MSSRKILQIALPLLLAGFLWLIIEDRKAASLLAVSLLIGIPITLLSHYWQHKRKIIRDNMRERREKHRSAIRKNFS